MERYCDGLGSWSADRVPCVSPAQTDNERYYHELAEEFLRDSPDGPFDYGAIRHCTKAVKTNNTVRGVYAALEDIRGPLPSIAPWEQARIANEAHYRNLAEQMLQDAAHPSMDYASIRKFLRATQNNKTVKGVYEQLEKLVEPAPSEVGDRSASCGALRSEQWPSGLGSRDWEWARNTEGHWYGGY